MQRRRARWYMGGGRFRRCWPGRIRFASDAWGMERIRAGLLAIWALTSTNAGGFDRCYWPWPLFCYLPWSLRPLLGCSVVVGRWCCSARVLGS